VAVPSGATNTTTTDPASAVSASEGLRDRAGALLCELAGPGAELRPDQLTAVAALVEARRRVLLVQATGWGKSAVYWIATTLLRSAGGGPTLVVSPLLALMRNQVAAARRMGIRAETLNSANLADWAEIERRIDADEVDVLLVSPERLNAPRFRREVLGPLTGRIGMLVVDEAHCISDWGHDFRPDYRRIADVLAGLPADVPVLAATATANQRVQGDVAEQVGVGTLTLRGSLDRPSLHLGVVEHSGSAHRLAWLAGWLAEHPGPGLVYCLTVSETERVASFLAGSGARVAAYTGATPAEERAATESALDGGALDAVVATSALGMGYDNPDLRWVVHLGSPSSPIAYYQQVGRAGRGSVDAQVVLAPTAADADVWAYFDATAMPARAVVDEVLGALERHGPASLVDLESMVNLRRGRLEALLKVLDVDGAVERSDAGWARTEAPWTYDEDRYQRIAAARRAEQDAMRSYRTTGECRLRFLRAVLDDPGAEDCGRCDNCTGVPVDTSVSEDAVAVARAAQRSVPVVIEPRKRWPIGVEGRRGNIAADLRPDVGRALANGTDPGWSEVVAPLLAGRDAPPDDDLLRGVAAALKAWDWGRRPTWVTWIPSRSRPLLVEGLASRLAEIGRLELVESLRRIRVDAPPQSRMENSVVQASNVLDAFEVVAELPAGPGLLVDDTLRSGWTMTVVAEALRSRGSGLLLPFVLWKRP
jgi:ATP-dependent DNA helicase RecQ